MMCFEISVSSGMSCKACRSEAEASANSRSIFRRGGPVGGYRRRDVRGVLQLRSRRQAVGFDNAGITHLALHAESITHRAGDDLELVVVHGGEGDEHHKEAHHRA